MTKAVPTQPSSLITDALIEAMMLAHDRVVDYSVSVGMPEGWSFTDMRRAAFFAAAEAAHVHLLPTAPNLPAESVSFCDHFAPVFDAIVGSTDALTRDGALLAAAHAYATWKEPNEQ